MSLCISTTNIIFLTTEHRYCAGLIADTEDDRWSSAADGLSKRSSRAHETTTIEARQCCCFKIDLDAGPRGLSRGETRWGPISSKNSHKRLLLHDDRFRKLDILYQLPEPLNSATFPPFEIRCSTQLSYCTNPRSAEHSARNAPDMCSESSTTMVPFSELRAHDSGSRDWMKDCRSHDQLNATLINACRAKCVPRSRAPRRTARS